MARIFSGPITTVREALQAERMLWAFCLLCGHATHMSPWAMAQRAGRDMTLREIAKLCRCTRCNARDGVVFPSRRSMPTPIKR